MQKLFCPSRAADAGLVLATLATHSAGAQDPSEVLVILQLAGADVQVIDGSRRGSSLLIHLGRLQ